ncbi:hypothetical protein GGR52DRAFT_552777 [Hypoxylon sp. FL1284]|nr:hypothetical protein GGR52DRAFT_552777 [Hypoxylon sp. FL1284]
MEQKQLYYETAGHVMTAGIALSVVDVVVLCLRFWVRTSKRQGLRMDDWLILAATVSTVAIGISMVYGAAREALGYRTQLPSDWLGDPFDVVTEQLTTTSKIEFAFALLLPLGLGCAKTSFLFLYRRIFVIDRKNPVNILLVGLIVFIALWAIAFFFAALFGCKLDIEAHWGSTSDLETQCVGSMTVVLALCITDFIADLAIIIIPIPLVMRLNMSRRTQFAICGIFLIGSVTVASSLTRLVIEGRAVGVGFAPGSDSVLVITEYIYWGFVECAVAILAACLVTLQGLMPTRKVTKSPAYLKAYLHRGKYHREKVPADVEQAPSVPLAPMRPARLPYDSVNSDNLELEPSTGLSSVPSRTPLIRD